MLTKFPSQEFIFQTSKVKKHLFFYIDSDFFILHPFLNHGDPCNLIGSHGCNQFTNNIIFCSKWHLFPANKETLLKYNQLEGSEQERSLDFSAIFESVQK